MLLSKLYAELLVAEKATIERVQHLQNEKKRHEALRSELSLECGKIQTNLQHQQDLIAVCPKLASFFHLTDVYSQTRDKQIKALLKKYSISVPFELSSELTSKAVNGIPIICVLLHVCLLKFVFRRACAAERAAGRVAR
jgi:hypothetical protein